MPFRRQAIFWINDTYFTDPYMHHSASMSRCNYRIYGHWGSAVVGSTDMPLHLKMATRITMLIRAIHVLNHYPNPLIFEKSARRYATIISQNVSFCWEESITCVCHKYNARLQFLEILVIIGQSVVLSLDLRWIYFCELLGPVQRITQDLYYW